MWAVKPSENWKTITRLLSYVVVCIILRFNNSLILQLENNLLQGPPDNYSFHLWSLDNEETMFWLGVQSWSCALSPKYELFFKFCRLLGQPGHSRILSAKDAGGRSHVCTARVVSRCWADVTQLSQGKQVKVVRRKYGTRPSLEAIKYLHVPFLFLSCLVRHLLVLFWFLFTTV